jgi:membrane protease YdiL (CAAX protease family)
MALLFAISVPTLFLAARGPGPTEPEATEPVAAPAEEPVESPVEEPAEEPPGLVETVVGLAERVLLASGVVLLLLILFAPKTRHLLLPPPRLAPRSTWGAEHIFYGVALAFATLVLVAAGVRLIPEESVVIGSLLNAAGQLAIAGTIVALVVTRPTALTQVFGLPKELAPAGSARERLASLGVSGRKAGMNLIRGVIAVVAAFPLAVGAGHLGRALHAAIMDSEPIVHPVLEQVMAAETAEIAALVAVACIAAPLAEELFFRGFLYPSIRDRFGVAAGAVVSSLLFASVHPGLPNQMATFVLGLVFCLVYERAGTLVAPVVAHAVFNMTQLAIVIAMRFAGSPLPG